MQKKDISTLLVCIFLILSITTYTIRPAKADTITVPDQYPTIQAAIDAASPGDTIEVKAGIYSEYIFINKPLTLLGEDPYTTIINGQGHTFVVLISNVSVTLSKFTLENTTRGLLSGFGININKNNATISNNIIRDVGTGIYFQASNYSKVLGNIIINCGYGISFSQGSNNTIAHNIIMNNDNIGLYFQSSYPKNNKFYLNSFNNTKQFSPIISANFWDNGTVGNYWSDYEGIDNDGDGIGDSIPYIFEGKLIDNKPLIVPPSAIPILLPNKQLYFINIQSNSTISKFHYDYSSKSFRFNTIGPESTYGFCNLIVPNELFNSPYYIILDGQQKTPDATPINSTHTLLHFTYLHTPPEKLQIIVVPEFSSPLLLSLLAITFIAAFVVKTKRKLFKTKTINYFSLLKPSY